MNVKTESEMLTLGKKLGVGILARLQSGKTVILELLGDVGAGKTTLTRGIAEGLGMKDPVTSPSFTISKRYAFPIKNGDETAGTDQTTQFGQLVHYDFYRLPDPGLMSEELAETISEPNSVIILEWADSVEGILPENRAKITIFYLDDGSREVKIDDGDSNLLSTVMPNVGGN